MSMFPPHDAHIIRNEAGEPLGWDYPSEPEYDPDDYLPGDDYDEEEAEDMPWDKNYRPIGEAGPEQTWPDINEKCEAAIKDAFAALNEAPGYRRTYERVQAKLAEAVRILRGME